MKRLLLMLLTALLILVCVLVGRTLLLPEARLNRDSVQLPAAIDAQRAAESLAAAIRLPTISHQIGAPAAQLEASQAAFAGLRQWLAERYPRVSQQLQMEETGSQSLLLRWSGQNRQLPAVLLMAHQDVVPVVPGSEAQWTHPPFAGVIADGYVWGRGAIDTKGSLVAILEACEALLAQGFTPPRDVLLAFGHDEEIGGSGNRRLAAQLKAQGQRLAWVNDEGGFIVRGQVPGVSQDVAVVGIAEKGYLSVLLKAKAQGGHSSQPQPFAETAVGRLSQALQRIAAKPFSRDLEGPTRQLLDSVSPAQSFGYRMVFANLWLFAPLVEQQMSATPAGAAQLQTTLAPTLLRSGVKENVLPSEARAILNLRLHPRDSIDSVLAHLREAVNDPLVTVQAMPGGREASKVSDAQGAAFRQFAEVIRQSFGNTLVAPNLTVGGTDSRSYEGLSDNIFRFSPLLMEPGDLARMHGDNERVAITTLANAAGFYYRLLGSLTSE